MLWMLLLLLWSHSMRISWTDVVVLAIFVVEWFSWNNFLCSWQGRQPSLTNTDLSRIIALTVLLSPGRSQHSVQRCCRLLKQPSFFSLLKWGGPRSGKLKLKHIPPSPFSISLSQTHTHTHTNRVRLARVRLIASLGTSGPLEVGRLPPFRRTFISKLWDLSNSLPQCLTKIY